MRTVIIGGIPDRVVNKITLSHNGCWEWNGATNSYGYGVVGVGRRSEGTAKVHRYVWEHFNGQIPDGLHVLHRCDNPPCCNPDHLFLGNDADNVADKISKGRQPRGSDFSRSNLVDRNIRQMFELQEQGWLQREISEYYGISRRNVGHILSRTKWAHVCLEEGS